MAQVLYLRPPVETLNLLFSRTQRPLLPLQSSFLNCGISPKLNHNHILRWNILQQKLKCRGRWSCLFSDNNKQEQARKALESALGGKKSEFEKWNKEIQKREEADGGNNSGGGGWFGGGNWFSGSNGDHFWKETQQASIALLGIIFVVLLIAKGNVMFAIIFNSLLFVLRGARNMFSFLPVISSASNQPVASSSEANQALISAKESVTRKWRMD